MEALLAALGMLLEKAGLTLMTTPSKFGMAVNGFPLVGGGGGGSTHLKDFGLGTGSVDYGLVTQSVSSSEDWGSSLSLLSN